MIAYKRMKKKTTRPTAARSLSQPTTIRERNLFRTTKEVAKDSDVSHRGYSSDNDTPTFRITCDTSSDEDTDDDSTLDGFDLSIAEGVRQANKKRRFTHQNQNPPDSDDDGVQNFDLASILGDSQMESMGQYENGLLKSATS